MDPRASHARVWIALFALGAGTWCGFGELNDGVAWAAGCAGVVLLPFRRQHAIKPLAWAAIAFALGFFNSSIRIGERAVVVELAEHVPRCSGSGRLLEHAGGLGSFAVLDHLHCTGFRPVGRAGIVVVEGAELEPGRAFTVTGWLVPLSNDAFDEARRRLGALATFYVDDAAGGPPISLAHALAGRIRSGLRSSAEALEARRAALLLGLTIGDTGAIDHATTEALRRSGLAHLVAVSGSNVAIVVGAVAILCVRLRLSLRVGSCALALGVFVFVTGPEPSVLRAVAMGAVGLAALAWGRRAEPLSALGAAALVVIALRPAMVYSVGLYLSVAATAGIVLWTGAISRRLRLPRVVALPLAVTTAAQAAVAPILVASFGQLSLVGAPANLLAAPAVPPATVLGFLAGLAGLADERLGRLVARLAEPFVGWIVAIGDLLGTPAWAAVELPRWSATALCLPYAAAGVAALRRAVRSVDGVSVGAPGRGAPRDPFDRGVRFEGGGRVLDGRGVGEPARGGS